MEPFGGAIVNNHLDSDYYRAAILHLLQGQSAASFAPGIATRWPHTVRVTKVHTYRFHLAPVLQVESG